MILAIINASSHININTTERCIMKLRSDYKDLTGQRFGKLVVVESVKRHIKRGVEWLCQCDCGDQCFAYGGHLRANERKSCGCMASDHVEDSGVRMIKHDYEIKSLKRQISFDLSFEDFKSLIKGLCFYCGTEPLQVRKRPRTKKVQIIWNGVDRIDSSLGYTKENCVPCCKHCNFAKSDLSVKEFKDHIKRIYEWLSIGS